MDQLLVQELIQDDLTPARLKEALLRLFDTSARQQIIDGYEELHRRLGSAGASERTASLIFENLQKNGGR